MGEWTNNERDSFKRFILIYGYSRWKVIKEASKQAGYNLDEKTDEEMNLYANGLFSTIIEHMQGSENKEIKQFLVSLVESTTVEGQKPEINPQLWGAEVLI